MSSNEQELNTSSQDTLKTFEQQLKFICDLQETTLEDVSMIQSEAADILNQSISEMGHFQSFLSTSQMTSAGQEKNESNDIIYTEDNMRSADIIEEEDCFLQLNLLHESVGLSLEVTSENLGTLDSIVPFSDSDPNSPVNADTQQNYDLQYTNIDNRKLGKSNVSFESKGVHIQDFKKQAAYTQYTNGIEESELGSLGISDGTFNSIESGPLNSTNKYEAIAKDDTLYITDLISPCDYTQISPECKTSGKTVEEETEDNKNAADKDNLDKLFRNINTEIVWLKRFLSQADLVKNPNLLDNKHLQKTLRHLHVNAQCLSSENLQCREQISNLRTERIFLRIQLFSAEKVAETYRQQTKAMTDKYEDLLKQRKQVEDERNLLSFQKASLMKEIELLKEDNKTFFKDLSAAITEKIDLMKKLDSSKKMALSYAREKQEMHRKWNETLMENYQLMRKVEECRTQHLKSIDIIYTENKRERTDHIEEHPIGKCKLLHETVEVPLMVKHLGTPDSTGSSSDSDQTSLVNGETQQSYNLQYTNKDNCKPLSFEREEVNLRDFKKQASYTQHSNGIEEAEFESSGISDRTFNVIESGPLDNTMKIISFEDIAKDDTLYIADLIKPCDYTHFSPECKESEKENLHKLFKSMSEDIARLKRFLREADWVEIPDQHESKSLQKDLRQLHVNAKFLTSEILQCREQNNKLRSAKSFLRTQLSIAEQDAETYRQQAKTMTDKYEELLKQRKQVLDEKNHPGFQEELLMRQIELLKEEREMFLKNQSVAITEKEELIKKLDSSMKMAMSYAREKEEIQSKWSETLMENNELKRKADEYSSQDLKKIQEYAKTKEANSMESDGATE